MPRRASWVLAFSLFSLTTLSLSSIAPLADAETSIPSSSNGQCAPLTGIPKARTAGRLTVDSPPQTRPLAPGLRMRTHTRGNPGYGSGFVWNGIEVPSFVPISSGNRLLDLLDRVGTTYVALYRQDILTCMSKKNCSNEVRLFDCGGKELASVVLDPHMSRADHLEVQDVRYDGTTLFFNEACQSYSSEAGGKCSALVALDPIGKKVLWRTGSLVSNNWFAVTGDYLVAAYGFTMEPATLRVLRKKDGAIMDTKRLQGTNFELFQDGDTIAAEHWHDIGRAIYKMQGFDGASPKLVRTANINPSPADPSPTKKRSNTTP
jgi:hypothetical protein